MPDVFLASKSYAPPEGLPTNEAPANASAVATSHVSWPAVLLRGLGMLMTVVRGDTNETLDDHQSRIGHTHPPATPDQLPMLQRIDRQHATISEEASVLTCDTVETTSSSIEPMTLAEVLAPILEASRMQTPPGWSRQWSMDDPASAGTDWNPAWGPYPEISHVPPLINGPPMHWQVQQYMNDLYKDNRQAYYVAMNILYPQTPPESAILAEPEPVIHAVPRITLSSVIDSQKESNFPLAGSSSENSESAAQGLHGVPFANIAGQGRDTGSLESHRSIIGLNRRVDIRHPSPLDSEGHFTIASVSHPGNRRSFRQYHTRYVLPKYPERRPVPDRWSTASQRVASILDNAIASSLPCAASRQAQSLKRKRISVDQQSCPDREWTEDAEPQAKRSKSDHE